MQQHKASRRILTATTRQTIATVTASGSAMRLNTLHLAASLAVLVPAVPASTHAQEMTGVFTADRAGMEQQATITAGTAGAYHVRLTVSAERCVGKLDATGRMQGDILVASPPKPDDACRITIRKTGSGIAIDEDKCLSHHGAACEFSGPYAAK